VRLKCSIRYDAKDRVVYDHTVVFCKDVSDSQSCKMVGFESHIDDVPLPSAIPTGTRDGADLSARGIFRLDYDGVLLAGLMGDLLTPLLFKT
jgi:hypothetical protein